MEPPNLLFIYTDQQRADTLAAYGNDLIQMPNLNRLAEESVVFDQAYVAQPVCQPSRSTLLTGLYPHTTGCFTDSDFILHPLRSETPCLPELIEEGDYFCGHHGKWHLGDDVFAQHGFHDWVSTLDHEHRPYYTEGRDTFQHCDYYDFLVGEGFEPDLTEEDGFQAFTSRYCARLPEKYGTPAYLARSASRFIRENRARPFILHVSIVEPHQPYFGPRDDMYDPSQVTLSANFGRTPTEEHPLKIRALHHLYRERGFEVPLDTEEDWRELTARYWGLCSLVDTHVGTILDTLEECGLSENTIVVFTSDHGEMMGSHGLRGKGLMFEESVRVPLMIRLPGRGAGKRVKGPVSHIDLVPTLLDLMGQPVADHLQGKSLRPLIQQSGTPTHEDDVFIEWQGPVPLDVVPEAMKGVASEADIRASCASQVRTIVTPDKWKFNCSQVGEDELYNLEEDPIETRNLAREPQYRSLVGELTRRIRRWQEETGDTPLVEERH